ncbi:MAG: RNA 2',3'-cyclic phosphodiesterase [candidate division WOR-3 bacterium]
MRLFVAIELSEDVRTSVWEFERELMANYRHARWVARENLHLTLMFIGEVDARRADEIKEALRGVRAEPFAVSLEGLGSFPEGKPVARVLWIGVAEGAEKTRALAEKVRLVLEPLGIRDDKPFSPHLTLARGRRETGIPLQRLGSLVFRPVGFKVLHFSLMESKLRPEGPLYTRIASYPLVGE